MEGDFLTIMDTNTYKRRVVGKKIYMESEIVNGKRCFLGKYSEKAKDISNQNGKRGAILVTETVRVDNRIIIKKGEIFSAPYFILDIIYDRFSFIDRLSQIFKPSPIPSRSGTALVETINQLRETVKARDKAYRALERTNLELTKAKKQLENYSQTLEQKVDERTAALVRAQEKVQAFNKDLKAKVDKQVSELKRYDELRRYLSPKLTEKILTGGDFLNGEPKRKMMTVFFSDIRGFSTLTDNLEPEELFYLLDRYLSEMIKLIHQYDGTLNKIIGDGMLVFFGDPIDMDDHAQHAVRMALDMQKKVYELKHEWNQYGYDLGVGIGINTGYMTVGNIGSDTHRDYTVIGNQVNVAARLESLAKAGQILISQRTFSRVSHMVDAEQMGEIKVKGISTPVLTYNVTGNESR
jgi:class 3 adenylate cyclase